MQHPNRVAFRGLLARLNEPSDRAPSGARGHRVILSSLAAERALESLIGMGVDYHPTLIRHDFRNKVGVITEAEVTEHELLIRGHLFGRDFPEIVEITPKAGQLQANAESLGMSYEGTEAAVLDERSAIWHIESIIFTGAAILKREKAAYGSTWIELS